ncbi:DNA cross-link repair protein SNM1, partial [Mucuna pruriens]
MVLSTAASPPPALEEEPLPHNGDGYDVSDDGPSFSIVSLDNEGFPSQLSGAETALEKSSFTADFYRCGTDWSSLLPEDNRHSDFVLDSGKKLKQANLFQIWGFKRNDAVDSVESGPSQSGYCDDGGVSSERKIVKPENWGSIMHDTGKELENTKSSRKRKGSGGENRVTRSCPFYKKIPGTTFTVDAFRYGCVEGCSAYFLSHFHSDHYGGLSKKWSHGPIYCSPLTGRLVQMCLSVNPLYIHPLEINTEHVIDGVKVTLLEANHCPGAALIHFDLPNGQRYLHTGDFRACKAMQAYHLLVNQRVNVLYLDTTYCNPKYRFPSKEDVLNCVVKITKNHLKLHPRTLVVVGAYSIGKECVYLAISKALGTLKDYLKTYKEQFTAILAFRPTGWTFSEKIRNDLELIKPVSRGNITIYGKINGISTTTLDINLNLLLGFPTVSIPASQNCEILFSLCGDNYKIALFCYPFLFLRPEKIIPTVNVGNAANREKMQSYFRDWLKG